MPYLCPPTLTKAEQAALLQASCAHPRDHLIFSLALGTGLRLVEIVGLDVGDLYFPDGRPRSRIRLRSEIAKGGRVGDVFLPDALEPQASGRRFIARDVSGETAEVHSSNAPILGWKTAEARDGLTGLSWPDPQAM